MIALVRILSLLATTLALVACTTFTLDCERSPTSSRCAGEVIAM